MSRSHNSIPPTFMDKYCPDRFEILNANDYKVYSHIPNKRHGLIKDKDGSVNGKRKYIRILVKNKYPEESKQRKSKIVLSTIPKKTDFR